MPKGSPVRPCRRRLGAVTAETHSKTRTSTDSVRRPLLLRKGERRDRCQWYCAGCTTRSVSARSVSALSTAALGWEPQTGTHYPEVTRKKPAIDTGDTTSTAIQVKQLRFGASISTWHPPQGPHHGNVQLLRRHFDDLFQLLPGKALAERVMDDF